MKRFFESMIEARQNKANREIAAILSRTEFKHESYDHILNHLNNGTFHELTR